MQKSSRANEDYLKAIYALQDERGARVSTSAVAERLGVSAPAATTMIKKLAALGLVEHEPYRGVRLTRVGRLAAVEVIRHHRLLEQYLVQRLGVAIDEVHQEAELLEHALSEELEARIDRELGFPTHDPHGDPIPDAELKLPGSATRTLDELEPGESATVHRVPDRDGPLLRYLSSLGLVPGRAVELLSAAPFGGPLVLLAGGAECTISRDLAALIGIG
ncbi:MAG TPA: metal-dependent transcriptional regulator [Gaiellaceae bacterium]|nr:metal-dependent transcriptional regulator [Gaiellaceae bacterium]